MWFKRKWWGTQHLKYKKWCAYRRIQRRGDVVLGDNSFVMYSQHRNKFTAFLMIVTREMINDLNKINGMDN